MDYIIPNTHAGAHVQLSATLSKWGYANLRGGKSIGTPWPDLGFPPGADLWLARMLMLECLSISPHKIICFIWASDQSFHHLLVLKVVVLTKEGF